MNTEIVAAPPQEQDVFTTGLWDDLRYLIMRGTRLVVLLAVEAGGLISLGMMVRAGLWWSYGLSYKKPDVADGIWLMDFAYRDSGHAFWFFLATGLVSWVLIYAAGLPYRYETTKPGLNARRCGRCRVAIPDELFCPMCKAFRPTRVASVALWLGSLLVTVLFVVHDVLAALLTAFMLQSRK